MAAVAKNDQASWNHFLHFATSCLHAPKRVSHCWNLVREINEQIRVESDPPPVPSQLQPHLKQPKTRDPLEALASLVASKLEEGNLKGAVRLGCSQETIADTSDKTLVALRWKHSPPHPDTCLPPPPEDSSLVPLIMDEAVATAIRSFPNSSAGGPDDLSPQHLKDMNGASAQGGGPALLRALTFLISVILQGKTPKVVHPFFFGASLVVFEKKDGGMRPIAVRCTIRCLAAKTAGSCIIETMGSLLASCQLGYGTPQGAEQPFTQLVHFWTTSNPVRSSSNWILITLSIPSGVTRC